MGRELGDSISKKSKKSHEPHRFLKEQIDQEFDFFERQLGDSIFKEEQKVTSLSS